MEVEILVAVPTQRGRPVTRPRRHRPGTTMLDGHKGRPLAAEAHLEAALPVVAEAAMEVVRLAAAEAATVVDRQAAAEAALAAGPLVIQEEAEDKEGPVTPS